MQRLHIYNTLTRQKQEFIPFIEEWKKDFVWIYSCGPTVYDEPHFGNLRAAFTADMIRNVMKNIIWYKTIAVSNFTDVWHIVWDADVGEDKMEKWSKKTWLNVWELAKKYEDIFRNYFKKLNVDPFDFMPRATEFINEQLEIVLDLEKKWYTYIIPWDWVYFDTSKVSDYGKLLWPNFKKHLEWLRAWERVDLGGKKNPTDFALWKFSPVDEKRQMEWDSPWWKSFPWWHTECCAMATKYLWKQFDIHHGWYDLIPVHHTNEIVQSELVYGTNPRVKYWIHHQFVNMNWEKMSKSKWNYVSPAEIEPNGFSFIDFRYFLLISHYRSFLDFSWESLQAAKNTRANLIKKLTNEFAKIESEIWELIWVFDNIKNYEDFDNKFLTTTFGQETLNTLIESLFDDFNTPQLLADINKAFWQITANNQLKDLLLIIFYLDEKLLKLDLYKEVVFQLNKKDIEIPADIKDLAEKRWQAKLNKDYSAADEIKKQIQSLGYDIKDSKEWYEIVIN